MRTLTCRLLQIAALALTLVSVPGLALARTEISWWHAMTGALGDAVDAQVKQFNESQAEYEVKPVRKGTYPETLTAAIAAYRQKNPPHIVQVFEVGTQTMMLSGAVYPVWELMRDNEIKVDWNDFIKPVVGYYTKDGKLYSMPYNSSTPIFYYNKDAFKKAGLDPEKPPKTWPEVEAYAKKIIAAGGAKCGFSTGWPSWTMVENMHATHDQPFASKHNGFDGVEGVELLINREFGQKHIGALNAWQKDNVYSYGGRQGAADPKFVNGDCAMYIQSSAVINGFTKSIKFDWGTGELPHWGAPYKKATSIIGGATLWVLNQKDPAMYKGIAKFFTFLSSPEVQEEWHENTGYVPITLAAYDLAKKKGLYEQRPGFDIAIKELTNKPPTANSRGLRLGNFVQIRNIIDEELEAIWSNQKSAKQGLDDAVKRGNEQIERFQKANQ
ncbi:MAG TPA: sn-glycerol-3-phosphate ABC transporter substrate-binding protein UgpB [Candidatus Binatia bacterium]|nr:sn-glycerol-3-phosphate ABC transporter substrate-binding protein UgpB [Candidatus Binatia bacterium]